MKNLICNLNPLISGNVVSLFRGEHGTTSLELRGFLFLGVTNMMRRFLILTSDGIFEGWAQSPAEMKIKFRKEFPMDNDVCVFRYGSLPHGQPLNPAQQELLDNYIEVVNEEQS